MKNIIITSLIAIGFFISCQKDDFCVDPITPNLVIGFYDDEFPDKYKTTIDLDVWASGLDTIYNGVAVDSIIIPLNTTVDQTVYYLKSEGISDSITINYNREEVFVSRSCGFKYIFTNTNLTDVSNAWIKNTLILDTTIDDENEHIKILY